MQIKEINVSRPVCFNIGQQYSNEVLVIHFKGLPDLPNKYIYVKNYSISMANGWNYVKQQLNDNRDYIYDMDLQSAEAYVNSEYAVTLTELEV